MRKEKTVNAELQTISPVRSSAFRWSGKLAKRKDRVNAELQTISPVRSSAFRWSGKLAKEKDRVNAELQTRWIELGITREVASEYF